jgi:Protein of unknown function (DUF1360)
VVVPGSSTTRIPRAVSQLNDSKTAASFPERDEKAPLAESSINTYALVESVFLAGLAGLSLLTRHREKGDAEAVPLRELPVLAAATFALADLVAKEKVSSWLRTPFVVEGSDHKPVRPYGEGLRHTIGELLMCTRCVGTWSALGLVGLRTTSPSTGRAVSRVLALSGANIVLQSGFCLLAERADRARAETGEHKRSSFD